MHYAFIGRTRGGVWRTHARRTHARRVERARHPHRSAYTHNPYEEGGAHQRSHTNTYAIDAIFCSYLFRLCKFTFLVRRLERRSRRAFPYLRCNDEHGRRFFRPYNMHMYRNHLYVVIAITCTIDYDDCDTYAKWKTHSNIMEFTNTYLTCIVNAREVHAKFPKTF